MSVRRWQNIYCDKCGVPYFIATIGQDLKASTIREKAKSVGWRYYNLHGHRPKDMCPDCGPIKGAYKK